MLSHLQYFLKSSFEGIEHGNILLQRSKHERNRPK